jgi:hypothetical protein
MISSDRLQRKLVGPPSKAQIRSELFRYAIAGQFPTYREFYNRIRPEGKMGVFPWSKIFDTIAKEERSNGYPDITFVVRRGGKKPPYPGQIDFSSANPPDAKQLESLREGTDAIIALYCPPGTPNPYR